MRNRGRSGSSRGSARLLDGSLLLRYLVAHAQHQGMGSRSTVAAQPQVAVCILWEVRRNMQSLCISVSMIESICRNGARGV